MKEFKDAIHKFALEWDESLHLPGLMYWKLNGVTNPQDFFIHLPKIFPYGMTLLFEDDEMSLTSRALYEEHPAVYRRMVACDTIHPVPESFHVAFSAEFARRLCQLLASQGKDAAFTHFKGYSEREIVFRFHDAFVGEFVLSHSVPETAVREFATALGCTVELAVHPTDLREQVMAMDRMLNPPWWRRMLRVFTRKDMADNVRPE
jgi:hypothetical protein